MKTLGNRQWIRQDKCYSTSIQPHQTGSQMESIINSTCNLESIRVSWLVDAALPTDIPSSNLLSRLWSTRVLSRSICKVSPPRIRAVSRKIKISLNKLLSKRLNNNSHWSNNLLLNKIRPNKSWKNSGCVSISESCQQDAHQGQALANRARTSYPGSKIWVMEVCRQISTQALTLKPKVTNQLPLR